MKLGLERSSLSGAFLETLPPISNLFQFHLNYTDLFIALKGTADTTSNRISSGWI